MANPTDKNVIWRDRPSVLLYSMTYLLTIFVIYIVVKIQNLLAVYYFPLKPWQIVYYTDWVHLLRTIHLSDWRIFAIVVGYVVMAIMLLVCIQRFFKARLTEYILMNDQLVIRKFVGMGVVEYRVEMYRIVDFMQSTMGSGGLMNLSTVVMRSTSATTPMIQLVGLRDSNQVIEILRTETERCRQVKGVQEFVTPQMANEMSKSMPPGRKI